MAALAVPGQKDKIDPKRTVVVSNVDSQVDEAEAKAFFEYCGHVTEVKLYADAQNPGNKKAVVVFQDAAGADMAMMLTDTVLGDCEISVSSVKVDQSRITVGELTETFRTLVGRSSSADHVASEAQVKAASGRRKSRRATLSRPKNPAEESMKEHVEKYKTFAQGVTKAQKVAAAGGLCIAAAGIIFATKQVSAHRKRERERSTRNLIAAYDHLFRNGPQG